MIGNARERVWFRGRAIPNYRPDPTPRSAVRQLAAATGAEVVSRRSSSTSAVRAVPLGRRERPVEAVGTQLEVVPLGRWFVLASLVPLGFLLWRRNVV